MHNLLALSSHGRLCKNGVRNPLTLATMGHLGCVLAPVVPVPPPPTQAPGGGAGTIWYDYTTYESDDQVKDRVDKCNKDDEEVLMVIIRTFIKCHDENIL